MALPYRPQPVDQLGSDASRPGWATITANFAREVNRVLKGLLAAPGSGGGGGGGGAGLATRIQQPWVANGPFRVDTTVDGAWVVPTAFTVTSVKLWRGQAGTAGSTILDINRNGTTIYTTQANRPTIAYNDSDDAVDCVLPDSPSFVANDIITIDTDQVESGRPSDWRLTIEGS